MKRIAALLAVGLALVACGEDEFHGVGRIVEHRYDDVDIYTTGGYPIIAGKVIIFVPATVHREQERFLLAIEDAEGRVHEVSVHKGIWDNCHDNSTYDTETQRCS